MLQRAKEEIMGSTAVDAVAHSDGKGAPEQVPEEGAMERRRAAASCWRAMRGLVGVGIARAEVRSRVRTAIKGIMVFVGCLYIEENIRVLVCL
jgi:hypothetical protein